LDYAYFTNKKVLDVGSGEGLLTIEIAMRCFPAKIIALDIDSHFLEKLKKKVDKIISQNNLYCKSSEVVLKKVQ
jgi:ubiquinone/menaquinone biosynthesis C-methylase UbiE